MIPYDQLSAFCDPLVRRIGATLSKSLKAQDFEIREKAKNDLVTEMDLWSEAELGKAIKAAFPTHGMLGEEAVAEGLVSVPEVLADQEYCWLVDPVDGTSNFASGIPHFAISVALLKDSQPLFGCVYDPSRDELFTGYRSAGASMNGEVISVRERKTIGEAVLLSGLTSVTSGSWTAYRKVLDGLKDRAHKVRIQGAGVLDQCWAGMGRVDAFFQYGLYAWDKAAASLIAQEAGATIGSPGTLRGFSLDAPSILVANPTLYTEFEGVICELEKAK